MSREKEQAEFVRKIADNNNYIKQKNTMLVHLADRSIWNLFNKTFKDTIHKTPTDDINLFIHKINTEPQHKEDILYDQEKTTLIGIDRLDVFAMSQERKIAKKYRADFKRFHRYNLQATNYVGQFVLDGLYKKDYVTWFATDEVSYLKSRGLLNEDSPDGTYMFLLVFPYKKDYPYSLILHIGDKGMLLDNTAPYKYLDERTYDLLKSASFVHFMDAGQFVSMFNEDDFELWKTDRIELSTSQQRFRFIRRYVAGMSQHDLAMTMSRKPYFIEADQKKIAYWEKTSNEVPPYIKNEGMLNQIADIFSLRCREFLGIELRDNVGQDYVSRKNIKNWIYQFIIEDQGMKLWDELPDFVWRVMKEDKPVNVSSKKKRYEEAVRKFELEERINQQIKYKKEDITPKIMSEWFSILYIMSERELIQDLQLVYDNNDDRSNVYDLYMKIQEQFPNEQKVVERNSAKWQEMKFNEKTFKIKAPFDN